MHARTPARPPPRRHSKQSVRPASTRLKVQAEPPKRASARSLAEHASSSSGGSAHAAAAGEGGSGSGPGGGGGGGGGGGRRKGHGEPQLRAHGRHAKASAGGAGTNHSASSSSLAALGEEAPQLQREGSNGGSVTRSGRRRTGQARCVATGYA